MHDSCICSVWLCGCQDHAARTQQASRFNPLVEGLLRTGIKSSSLTSKPAATGDLVNKPGHEATEAHDNCNTDSEIPLVARK